MESRLLRPLCQAVALALAAGGAHAATITVTDGGDAGTGSSCTLRQAIDSANSDSAQGNCTAGNGTDTIVFASALANSTIALQGSQLLIDSNVTLSGSGQTIDAGGNSRVMAIDTSNAVTSVTLSNLSLTGGNYARGAGLSVYAGEGGGGGYRHADRHGNKPAAPTAPADVTLYRVTISNSTSGVGAGGVYIDGQNVAIEQSTVSGNTLTATRNYGAGGVYITGSSSVTITDSTISGNRASGSQSYLAGGVYVWHSDLTVTNSTITGNTANGMDDLAGAMSLANASGAVYDSTISGNQAAPSNTATGGILVGAEDGAGLNLFNTIVSGNSALAVERPAITMSAAAMAQPDMGVYNSSNVVAQFNLFGTALQPGYSGSGNVFNDAPGLGALANNGGPTLTMKPNAGSPAIGAGSVALLPAGLATDQRGAGFPRTTNNTLDLGAIQAGAGAVAAAPVPTPTLSTWALGLLGGLLALVGLRKRKPTDA